MWRSALQNPLQSLDESEGKALAMTQPAGDSQNELKRDGVGNKHVFSCINAFNLPDVSVVSPINVAKLAYNYAIIWTEAKLSTF